jgi:hypothetical protein
MKELKEERETILFLIKDMSENAGDYPMRSHTRTYILESYMTRLVQVDRDIQKLVAKEMYENQQPV